MRFLGCLMNRECNNQPYIGTPLPLIEYIYIYIYGFNILLYQFVNNNNKLGSMSSIIHSQFLYWLSLKLKI